MNARNETAAQLPVPMSTAAQRGEARERRPGSDACFTAQLLGAGGERRGLKGGPVVLDAARAAYLDVQYAGLWDRRLANGALRRDRV